MPLSLIFALSDLEWMRLGSEGAARAVVQSTSAGS